MEGFRFEETPYKDISVWTQSFKNTLEEKKRVYSYQICKENSMVHVLLHDKRHVNVIHEFGKQFSSFFLTSDAELLVNAQKVLNASRNLAEKRFSSGG